MAWTFTGDKPIYTQLVEHIQRRIVTGAYPPGERMAAVRELAAEAAVNPNTMQRALAELESQGLVYTQRTSGRYVTDDAQAIAALREKLAAEKVRAFMQEMIALGFSGDEILDILKKEAAL